QEQITLSFNIPILDWGIAKFKRKKAELALKDVATTIDQEKLDIQRAIYSTVNQYNIQKSQLQLVEKSKDLTAKRYEMSKERYKSGKINFLDYSVAQTEKDNAQLNYIQTLQKSYTKYQELRKLTLFDFEADKKIEP
ncbi:MAG: TolC family protein, partial [Bacteroidales bacterium]|nr:TolC family protein [Bacteroidales bacterium]